jgi:hypothetical protein
VKYFLALLVGMILGAALFGAGLYYNPFTSQTSVSPLAVTTERVIDLSYSAVPNEGILYTDNGDSLTDPFPGRVAKLLERTVSDTSVHVTELRDGRGELAGIGIKFASESEDTKLLNAEALVNSVWHIYLPGQGTFMVDQTENYWSYLREIVVPARLSSGKNWRGAYHGIMTNGPGHLGTARVTGGSGRFANLEGESVESVTARGYSANTGPVSMTGTLSIVVPGMVSATE